MWPAIESKFRAILFLAFCVCEFFSCFLRKNQQTAEKMEAGVLEDEVVSMVDVLHEDNELEEEARAVLGDSDDQHCTYLTVSSFKLSLHCF